MKSEYPEPTKKADKVVYTVSEVAAMLSVHPNTVYKMVKKGAFSSRKIGTDIRISKTSFDNWLDNKE